MKLEPFIMAGVLMATLITPAFGFDYSNPTISLSEIHSGGPPKDGIPALTKPEFTDANQASYLSASDRIIGLYINKEAKAYPIRILNWHEIVNDEIGEQPVLVTYCPLCGTGMVFDAIIKEKTRTFGVSGLLYNSDVLMYDRQHDGLWSQLKMAAVTGKEVGQKLTLLPSTVTTWDDWKTKYPQTKVLSVNTGHTRNYDRDPYRHYRTSNRTYFPTNNRDHSRHPKDWVYGVIINGKAKSYPLKELERIEGPFWDKVGKTEIEILFNKANHSVVIRDTMGQIIPGVQSYWFAWKAFYPNSTVFQIND